MIRALLIYLSPWSIKASQEFIDATIDDILRLPMDDMLIGAARVLTEPCDVPLKVRAAFVARVLLKVVEKGSNT